MPDLPSSDLDEPFPPAAYGKFAGILSVRTLTEAQWQSLKQAALVYLFIYEMDLKPGPGEKWKAIVPTRKQRRDALIRVIDAANDLHSTLTHPDLKLRVGEGSVPDFDRSALDVLVARCKALLETIPQRGADPKPAREVLVRQLAGVFEAVTEQRPTRRIDPSAHKRGQTGAHGPFHQLCATVLAYLPPHNSEVFDQAIKAASKGLDDVIKRVLQTMGKN